VTGVMGMPGINVLKAGLQTTVQDLGRWGFQALGVPVAGAMDWQSHRLANALVGNTQQAATLEVLLAGPELEFAEFGELDDARVVAVVGAEFDLTVDGSPVSMHAPFAVAKGSRVLFGPRRRGARAYLAVSGGIAVPEVLGSRATHVGSRMGGLDGRALMVGDRLPLGESGPAPLAGRGVRLQPDPGARYQVRLKPDTPYSVRVLPGPQQDRFTDDALAMLQSAPYTVQSESDRMGFRLAGPRLLHRRGADIISDATPLGTLQVPASGQPLLLMADRPTTGGYPKIATVVTADIPIAAQLAPGDTVSFELCTPQEALAALIAIERPLMALEGRA
jgi:antagonist of KipI